MPHIWENKVFFSISWNICHIFKRPIWYKTKYDPEKPQIYFLKVPFELYEVIKKNEKKNDIIKVEIGYYFLQSGEYNECDSICTLKISLYYIYKFMCEDKNCCYTAKSLPYTSCFDWIQNNSRTNVMSMHKSISQYHLFKTHFRAKRRPKAY